MRFPKLSFVVAMSFAIVMPSAVLTGCSDDDPAEPAILTLADFAGSWEAQTYKVTNVAVPAVTLEIIGFGSTLDWVVDASGGFTGSIFVPAVLAGQDLNLNFQGNFTLIGQDSLIINFTPEIPPFLTQTRASFEMIGSALTLTDRNSAFDFDSDGNMEAAIFEGTMVRN